MSVFKCLVDCADFDLVNDCANNDHAEADRTQGQRQASQASRGSDENGAHADAADVGLEQYSSSDEDHDAFSQDGNDEWGGPDAGQGTGEHADGLANAARQGAGPPLGQKVPPTSPGPGLRGVAPSYENDPRAPQYSNVQGGVPPPGSHDSELQALSVNAARVARDEKAGALEATGSGPIFGHPGGEGAERRSEGSLDGASAASAAAEVAAAAGRRASSSAADAVAAAAAAADAGTQEEAEAAADRAAKAAANAAAGAAGAARAAKEAGKAAAAEQAAMDSAVADGEQGGVETGNDPMRMVQTPEMSPVPSGGAVGVGEAGGGLEEVDGWDGSAQGRQHRRSASMGSNGGVNPRPAAPGRMSEPGFRSTPGASELQAAPTPGREAEGEKTWLMARRVASSWGEQEPEEESTTIPRTFVSTRLRHLRLSPDGTTLVVKSEKGGVDHELALDELLEVHETPSEESVTLMGRDIEIRIAFKGQAKALKQFRNMLVPAGGGSVTNTTTSNNAKTTITTIKEGPEPEADVDGVSSAAAASAAAAAASAASASAAAAAAAAAAADSGRQAPAPSVFSEDATRGAAEPSVSVGGGGGAAPVVARMESASSPLEGIDEDSTFSRPHSTSAVLARNMISSTSSIMSPASTASGWGSVKGNTGAVPRQLTSLTERSGVVAAGGGPVGAGGGAKEKGGSSAGGSTFADARERERVIATLQNSQDQTMSPVEREAKLHLVKYEQAGFVRGYEALCDQQQVRLRKRPEFSELESVGVQEGLADPSIVLRQPNASKSVDVHYADALRAKALLDDMMEDLSQGTSGLWVRSVPVKEKDSIKRKAANDYGGEVRRVLDMARTSVICETPEVVRQLTESLKQSEDVGHIGRMKNGFGSTAVGRGGYRDIKVNLQPANFAHYVEVQVHLREFYELNSRSHEVYEWARGVDLPEGTTPHLLFRNLTPDVQAEMTRLVKEDWMGLRRILPELLQATEQYNEAEPLLRQNVEDAEKRWMMAKNRFGDGHLHEMSCAQGVAMSLNNLALALKGRGDIQGAEPLLRRALQMSVDSQGAEHPEVATRLNSLALLLASDGRVQEAEDLHRQALDIARKVYGPEHADVATYLNNLARVLKAQDKLQEAEPLQRSALAIGERMLGTNHSDVATYYNNLSRLVRAAGKLEEAEPLQRRAVEIGEQVLGANSPDLATWVNNLGRLLMARKKLSEAEEVQERAVAIAENVYGPDHPQVARARKNLTKVRWALGKAARSRAPSSNKAYEA